MPIDKPNEQDPCRGAQQTAAGCAIIIVCGLGIVLAIIVAACESACRTLREQAQQHRSASCTTPAK